MNCDKNGIAIHTNTTNLWILPYKCWVAIIMGFIYWRSILGWYLKPCHEEGTVKITVDSYKADTVNFTIMNEMVKILTLYLLGMCHGQWQVQFINTPYLIGMVVHVMESNELSLLMLHIWLVGLFMSQRVTSWVYQILLVVLPCEIKRARDTEKTQTTEGTVITEQEVRNWRTMINDTILVGTCSVHHQH